MVPLFARSKKAHDLATAWRALVAHFNSQSCNMRLAALKGVLRGQKEKGQSISEFISTKETLVMDRLRGQITAEELIIMGCFQNVDNETQSVCLPLLTKPELKLADFRSCLVEFEASKGNMGSESQQASMNNLSGGSSGSNTGNGVFTQGQLNKAVNKAVANFMKGGGKGKGGKGKGDNRAAPYPAKLNPQGRRCYRCNSREHMLPNCPHPKGYSPKGAGKNGGKGKDN